MAQTPAAIRALEIASIVERSADREEVPVSRIRSFFLPSRNGSLAPNGPKS